MATLEDVPAEEDITVNGRSFRSHCDVDVPLSVQTTSDFKRQRFMVTDGSVYSVDEGREPPPNRAELSNHTEPVSAASAVWLAYSMKIDSASADVPYAYVGQLHQKEEAGDAFANPLLSLELIGTRYGKTREFSVVTRHSETVPLPPYGTPPDEADWNAVNHYATTIAKGRWYDIVIHLTPGPTGNGALEVWIDGVKVVDETNAPIGFASSVSNYWKYGIYDDNDTTTRVVWFANMEFGTADLSARITSPLPTPKVMVLAA